MTESAQDARDYWEQFYGDRERVWSGRVNTWLAETTADLAPGRALDLGCGEGAVPMPSGWPKTDGRWSPSTCRPPPWAPDHAREHHFAGVEEVLAALRLDDAQWDRVLAESADREAIGPDGQTATLVDNVIVLRRKG